MTFQRTARYSLPAAIFLLTILLSGHARAMPIEDFAAMNDDDDATYVTAMVEGTAKMLKTHGQADLAQKTINLFRDSSKKGGLNQLIMNLKTLSTQNTRNQDNPNNRSPVYDVEDAMALTLKNNGVDVTADFLRTINEDFRASGLPRSLMNNTVH
jgi:hypothetical protein